MLDFATRGECKPMLQVYVGKRVVPRVVCLICLSLALTCKHLIIFYTLYNDFHSQSF